MAMRYYQYPDEDAPIGGGMTYIATAAGRAIRQITVNGDAVIASNRLFPPWGLCLGEGQVAYEAVAEEVTEISPAEFETVWQQHRGKHQAQWRASKRAYPPGTPVAGWIELFFPQGVIVNLGKGTLGVANYAQCLASVPPPKLLGTRQQVTAVVSGYDEVNQWVVLDQPQVLGEAINSE